MYIIIIQFCGLLYSYLMIYLNTQQQRNERCKSFIGILILLYIYNVLGKAPIPIVDCFMIYMWYEWFNWKN